MREKKIRLTAMIVALVLLITGCGEETPVFDGQLAVQVLIREVNFDTELNDAGESASLFFPGLPEGSSVTLYSGSGYFADEVALITLQSESQISEARIAVQNHMEQMRNQFMNYVPEELNKIDNAVVYENGSSIVLCVTNDYVNAENLLKSDMQSQSLTTGAATSEPTIVPATTTQETTVPETTVQETTISPETTVPETTVPMYPVLRSESGEYYDYGNNTIRVDQGAFELYGYLKNPGSVYAGLVSKTADALQEEVNVYALAIPTAVGIVLPDDIAEILPSYEDQNVAIEDIFSQMSDSVIPVRCYENMKRHRDEYLYFHTDYHWNGRGAYYAYESFCETKGIEPIPLESRKESRFDGFIGALYSQTSGKDPILKENPDTVFAYSPVSQSASMEYTDQKGNSYAWNIITDVSGWDAGTKYSTFAGADNPIAVFNNPEVTDGSVCVVIKESYGNALLPYLVDHYSTIYEIDYRYWSGNIIDFTREEGASDLIFANNLSMMGSDFLIGKLAGVI